MDQGERKRTTNKKSKLNSKKKSITREKENNEQDKSQELFPNDKDESSIE